MSTGSGSRARRVVISLLVFTGLSFGCGKAGEGSKGLIGPTALVVTAISPNAGPTDTPVPVVISGRGFQPGATVTLDGAATDVRVLSSTHISAMTPAHGTARVDVVVTNPGGESTVLRGAYQYQDAAATPLVFFTEVGSGFSTTDLRDAQDQILRLNTAGELIWTADGTRLPGYKVETHWWPGATFISGKICSQGCAFEVRFGTRDGERRAYLTVDYGHDNPGTLVDVELAAGALVVTQTSQYAPGTFTLSGRLTEMTSAGEVPVEGAFVYRAVTTGWRMATTDSNGFYSLRGMFDSLDAVIVEKAGFNEARQQVQINGDTRFDVRMVRVLPGGGLQ